MTSSSSPPISKHVTPSHLPGAGVGLVELAVLDFVFLAVIIAKTNLELYTIHLHNLLQIISKKEWTQLLGVEPPRSSCI